jgi:hypothetical protein
MRRRLHTPTTMTRPRRSNIGTRRKPRRRPTVKTRNKASWSIVGPWLRRQQSTPTQMAPRSANTCWATGLFFVEYIAKSKDQGAQRNPNAQGKRDEPQVFHSRPLRSYGRSLLMSHYAEAMPLRQRPSAPCKQIIRRPEISGLRFGDAGRELAPWLGAGPPVVCGIDNSWLLNDRHWRSHGQDGPGRRGGHAPAHLSPAGADRLARCGLSGAGMREARMSSEMPANRQDEDRTSRFDDHVTTETFSPPDGLQRLADVSHLRRVPKETPRAGSPTKRQGRQ